MAFETRDYANPGRFGGAGRGFGGGGYNPDGPRGWPITTWLMVIIAVMFIIGQMFEGSARAGFAGPFKWTYFSINKGLWGLQVWRFLTYQFLHAGFLHMLFNMIGIYFFGPLMERALGRRAFLVFYLACGAAGALVASALGFLVGPTVLHPDAPLIGASGAVFGIIAGCAVRFPDQEVNLLLPPITLRMRTLCIILLVVAGISVMAGSTNAGGEAAHIGGALLGFLLMKFPTPLAWFGTPTVAGGYGGQKRAAGGIEGMKQRLADFKRERARKAAAEHAQEVDRILAKVSEQGIQSLTDREKKTLAEDTKRKR